MLIFAANMYTVQVNNETNLSSVALFDHLYLLGVHGCSFATSNKSLGRILVETHLWGCNAHLNEVLWLQNLAYNDSELPSTRLPGSVF